MQPSRLEQIARTLEMRGVYAPCPRCGQTHFTVANETRLSVEPTGLMQMPTGIPAAIVVCNNCGYIMMHATKPLGLAK